MERSFDKASNFAMWKFFMFFYLEGTSARNYLISAYSKD